MRTPFRVLPALVATACLGVATLTPVTAFAGGHGSDDDHQALTLVGDVAFGSATSGSVTVRYRCESPDADDRRTAGTLEVSLQPSEDDATPIAQGQVPVTCDDDDDDSASVVVPLTATVAEVLAGPAFLTASFGAGDGLEQAVTVVRTDLAPPVSSVAPVTLTVHASPGSVKEGKKITVKGTLKRDGKRLRADAVLEFAPDGTGAFSAVRTVRSSRSGKLSTSVKATTSGTFRFSRAADATTAAGVSAGDHVVVKPKHPVKPRKFADCTALVAVYPHGVGKPGAEDEGSEVVTFTRDSKAYGMNKKLDADKDDIACEV
ncbi:hypothetical protein GCM10022197_09390 [Microlunatus spumicola]|uniref:Excalibur calcium-binding domain-containing protein n=1 Tax=Microlunatus spumicola TaxID=81499 RepID=A0ABP6WXN4_9ACTN